jgi:membrane protein DedA with SNARE-associated domain
MFHALMVFWFNLVKDWGYLGVVVLMAMESSIFPVPSEVVIPPAAYWAAQGQMSFVGVIIAGTVGSYLGSAITYWVAKRVGIPFIERFGRIFLLPPEKVGMAEGWVVRYGVSGIFFARLLPVVRHLISIPAGILKMDFLKFSVATIIGSFIWCSILTWFGQEVIGHRPDLMDSPEALVKALKEKLHVVVFAIICGAVAYAVMRYMKGRLSKKQALA